jgi:uncharacterized membrane protein
MRTTMIVAALLAGTSLAACGDYNKNEYNEANASYGTEGNYDASAAGGNYGAAASGNWPEGTRIVEENHVYYRLEPSGTRVRLEPGDSTIVVDNGVRYRVDPGGTRVRINNEGAAISVGPGGVEANVPTGGNTSVIVNNQ